MATQGLLRPVDPPESPANDRRVKRVDFDLEPEDLIAFVDFHYVNSPVVRRQRWLLASLGFGVLSALPIMVLLASQRPANQMLASIWPLVVGPAAFAVCFPLFCRWGLRRTRNRLIEQGDKRGFFGPRTLSLEDYGVRETTARGETIRAWPTVRRILNLKEYTLIYTSATEAFVLPRRAIKEEKAFEEFVNFAAKRARLKLESY